jgi:hypothetical protein
MGLNFRRAGDDRPALLGDQPGDVGAVGGGDRAPMTATDRSERGWMSAVPRIDSRPGAAEVVEPGWPPWVAGQTRVIPAAACWLMPPSAGSLVTGDTPDHDAYLLTGTGLRPLT